MTLYARNFSFITLQIPILLVGLVITLNMLKFTSAIVGSLMFSVITLSNVSSVRCYLNLPWLSCTNCKLSVASLSRKTQVQYYIINLRFIRLIILKRCFRYITILRFINNEVIVTSRAILKVNNKTRTTHVSCVNFNLWIKWLEENLKCNYINAWSSRFFIY